jgi:hypothetical protein
MEAWIISPALENVMIVNQIKIWDCSSSKKLCRYKGIWKKYFKRKKKYIKNTKNIL